MIILTYVSTVLARFMKIYFYETLIKFESEKDSIFEILTQIEALLAQYLIWVFLTPALTIIVVFVINHFKERERLAHFKNKRNLTELKFLKAQLHPHFLFNTLNNLYTLAIQKSPKTPIVTQRLYEIFEYIFNRSNERVVQINEEIKLIKNYVELEKLRYDERLNVTLVENISDSSQAIVPLLLLSVVENAFKHGVSGDLNNPTIDIQIEEDNGRLNFIIENTKPTVLSADIQGYRKGIGVNNITRQLEILYPERHSYEVMETIDKYKVHIIIQLDSIVYDVDGKSGKLKSATL